MRKTHQNIVAVNTVVVDQSIYARNAMLATPWLDCLKDYHSKNTKLIALFNTGGGNNIKPATIFRKI